MNILVTGAAGFIGFHLSRALIFSGHNVVGIDNINTYYDVELKYGRLRELGIERVRENPNIIECDSILYHNFRFIKCDIADYNTLNSIFEQGHFDKVCNLAAQAGVRYSFENPHAYIQSNIVGFTNMLELSHKWRVKHFVYASSSSVYGNSSKVPFEEEDITDAPQSVYAATKKSNELLAYVYGSQLNITVTGLRFFTVYGPWGRPDMAPYMFLKSILDIKPIKVFNHGDLKRDFSYIDDIIKGTVKILESTATKKIAVYNIGNSKPINLLDFITTLEQVTGIKAIKEFIPMQKGDVYITYASTNKLSTDYGFAPNTPLEMGIKELYLWMQQYHYPNYLKAIPVNICPNSTPLLFLNEK